MNKFIRSVISFPYLKISNRIKPDNSDSGILYSENIKSAASPKIAFICDEMTWCDYSEYSSSIFLHSKIWRKQLEVFQPDILFCESAWCGIDRYHNCWRGRVYKDRRLLFENRKELIEIIEYCKGHGIKTVFWNKEDPTFFDNEVYDFTSSALMFDYIYTTASECIEKYESLGHKNVSLMQFGVNTKLFSFKERDYKKNTVVFAGSWFGDQKQRCAVLVRILDYVIEQGMELDIYDRKSECSDSRFRFPKKYQRYIKPAVDYTNTASVFSKYEYAININTVTDSTTMFSRRIFHLASMGLKIISNDSRAFKNLKGISVDHYIADDIVVLNTDPVITGDVYSTDEQFGKMLDYISGSNRRINNV